MSDAAIRDAQRETSARAADAAAWARLAHALSRAGDVLGACSAARSALRLDPAAECQELLPAAPAPTSTDAPTGPSPGSALVGSGTSDQPVDVGGGLLARTYNDRLAAVDVFAGSVWWTRRQRLRPWAVYRGRLVGAAGREVLGDLRPVALGPAAVLRQAAALDVRR